MSIERQEKVSRNDPCPCGSGKKYKKCCIPREPSLFSYVASYSESKYTIKNAEKYEIHKCYVNPDWRESGLSRIVVTRKQNENSLLIGVFLVDIFCLGVKDAFCNVDIKITDLENYILPKYYFDKEPLEIGISYAKEIIFGAIAYADKIGFRPHKDFELAKYILGEYELTNYHNVKFGGPNNKPFYIDGTNDNREAIIKHLSVTLGEGNYDFLYKL